MKRLMSLACLGCAALADPAYSQSRGSASQLTECTAIAADAVAAAPTAAVGRINEATLADPAGLHRVEVPAGQAVRIDALGDGFDSFMIACRITPGGLEKADENDDGGFGTAARLTLGPGRYIMAVSALGGGQAGRRYDLLVRRDVPPSPANDPRPEDVALGARTSQTMPATGTGPLFRFAAEAGSFYAIDMISEDFDSVVEVRRDGEALATKPLAEDDDSGGNRNARLLFAPPVSGRYVVATRSLNGGGAFTLAIAEQRPDVLAPGERSEQLTDGSKIWRFTAEPDTAYLIEMKSTAFDALLEVKPASGTGPTARDDDGGEGTNARLFFLPDRPGDFFLTTRSISEPAGAYTLSLTPYRRSGR
jgi:hypothetical protein